jgi:uncharacterized membrane protein
VIDGLMPERRRPMQPAETVGAFPGELEVAIASRRSGYIRYVDIDRLRLLAKRYRICLRLERRVGHFIPEGVTLLRTTRGDRITPEREEEFPPHVLRVVVPWIELEGVLDLAFEQIRHYGAADAAVSLRLMRALDDIAGTIDDPTLQKCVLERGRRLIEGCQGKLQSDDLTRLRRRFVTLESRRLIPGGARQSGIRNSA